MDGFDKRFQELLVRIYFDLQNGNVDEMTKVLIKQGKEVEFKKNKLIVKNDDFAYSLRLDFDFIEQLASLMFVLVGALWPLLFWDVYKGAISDIYHNKKKGKCQWLESHIGIQKER